VTHQIFSNICSVVYEPPNSGNGFYEPGDLAHISMQKIKLSQCKIGV